MIFNLFNIKCEGIRALLMRVFHWDVSIETLQMVIDALIIAVCLFIIFKYGRSICKKIKGWFVIHKKWRKKYIQDNLGVTFIEYKNVRYKNRYIPTRMQNEAPSIYEEPRMSVANSVSNNFIDHFLRNIFIEHNNERLYCILADSGMGKSTALVNLFISYIFRYKEDTMPFSIRILSLADDKVLDNIGKITNPANTILLLDALDENIEAVVNHKVFLAKLETLCSEFRFVVMSCRTQFFPSDEEQIKESKIVTDGSNKGYASYNTFYLSPFNDEEIAAYIDREFGRCKSFCIRRKQMKRRKKVDSIIANTSCRSLLVRPMILSHIKQLADDTREYRMTIDIYDAMLDYWLDREVGRIEKSGRDERKKLLKNLSKELAQNIYDCRIDRKGYYIGREDFNEFLTSRNLDNNTIHFKERSLLNRDAAGLVKFSHKSFLEYFLAMNYFEDATKLADFSGIEFTKELYYELCAKYFDQHASNGSNTIKVGDSSNRIGVKCVRDKKRTRITGEVITFPTLFILRLSAFNLRYLGFLPVSKLFLSNDFNFNLLSHNYDWILNITALEMSIYSNKNLQHIKKFENLRYLFLNGHPGMSKEKLMKLLLELFPKITLVLNDECLLRDGERHSLRMLFDSSQINLDLQFVIDENIKALRQYKIHDSHIISNKEEQDDHSAPSKIKITK